MGSPYYTPSGTPATNAQGSSSDIRSEFNLVETALDKMPTLTASYIVRVNSGGTSLEPVAQVPVAQGGTGVGTLIDGGLLLGGGTGNITAMAVLADGAMIVGDGTTAPVAETGATLRTSIGVGTGDTLTCDGLVLTTDLAVTHGGTGSSTASGAATNLGLGTGDTVTFNGLTLTTDLTVANGGTGVSTLIDGGILLGSGTGPITALAVLADGEMLVGDGATDPAIESGATLRTSIGVGTADVPDFSGLKINGVTQFNAVSDHFYRNN